MELAAIISLSVQVTEQKWEMRSRILRITDENTIGDITKWYRKHIPEGPIECTIVDLETVEPR